MELKLKLNCECLYLFVVCWEIVSSLDVLSSEMYHFEEHLKSTSFSLLPLLPPTVSVFSFLSVCVCLSLAL